MLQISFIKENKALVLEGLNKRGFKQLDLVDTVVNLDDKRRAVQFELDENLAQSRRISNEIAQFVKEGNKEGIQEAKQKTTAIKEKSHELKKELESVDKELLE